MSGASCLGVQSARSEENVIQWQGPGFLSPGGLLIVTWCVHTGYSVLIPKPASEACYWRPQPPSFPQTSHSLQPFTPAWPTPATIKIQTGPGFHQARKKKTLLSKDASALMGPKPGATAGHPLLPALPWELSLEHHIADIQRAQPTPAHRNTALLQPASSP